MSGFLDKFRKNVVLSVWKDKIDEPKIKDMDDKIALGVLLWVVAETDGKFLLEEEEKIREILTSNSAVSKKDMPLVLASVREAAKERIDLYSFTNEISEGLPYANKKSILEDLFRVACADKGLDGSELEAIRKISGLFHISHKDFIDAKIKIKKELGLDMAGL
ncbi:TerB family tellurite resistance protein [Candidatus Omnitrophota bacterium]